MSLRKYDLIASRYKKTRRRRDGSIFFLVGTYRTRPESTRSRRYVLFPVFGVYSAYGFLVERYSDAIPSVGARSKRTRDYRLQKFP